MDKKLLIIGGPTATGKTSLAVCLAKKFKGEIVSEDKKGFSFRVYKQKQNFIFDEKYMENLSMVMSLSGLEMLSEDEKISEIMSNAKKNYDIFDGYFDLEGKRVMMS